MREYFGQAGHFICSDRCRWHLHTHVNGYCVSSVGEFFRNADDEKPTNVDRDHLYETMVFRLTWSGEPDYGNCVASDKYNDQDAANAGHERMVCRFAEAILT